MTHNDMLTLLRACGLSCSTCLYYLEDRFDLGGYEHVFGECTARSTTAGGHPSTDEGCFCNVWEPEEEQDGREAVSKPAN